MKKVLGLVLVLVMLMSVAVFAADKPTFAPESDGTYTVPYSDGTSGNYYALLVVEGVYEENETPVISEDTVLYIDQATADSSGDVSFDGWIPKNSEPATVYLGGTGLTSPVLLGYLGESTFFVSGTVTTDSGTSYEALVTLTSGEDTFTVTSVNGAYSIEVPGGTYTFTVNVKNHLSYTKNNLEVSADVAYKEVTVLGGDLDGDGAIDSYDLGKIVNAYNTDNDEIDIDGDGAVDSYDRGKIVNNYNSVAVVE